MKKISHLFFITLLLSFIIPGLALASWWNPFSWFRADQTAPSMSSSSTQTISTTTKRVSFWDPFSWYNKNKANEIKESASSTIEEAVHNKITEVKEISKTQKESSSIKKPLTKNTSNLPINPSSQKPNTTHQTTTISTTTIPVITTPNTPQTQTQNPVSPPQTIPSQTEQYTPPPTTSATEHTSNCTPNWQCGSWNTCVASQQTRSCNDTNSCNSNVGKPVLTQSCSVSVSNPNQTISNDDTLSNLNVEGVSVTNFDSEILSYNYLLSSDTVTVPVVTATTKNIKATKIITQATDLTGTAKVLVTAQNGTTTRTYTVNFAVKPKIIVENGSNNTHYAVVGSTDNNLFNFKINTNSLQGVELSDSIIINDNILNNSNRTPSFKNLTLWNNNTKISGPIQITVGPDGVGTINFPLENSLLVKSSTPLSFQIRGDVNTVDTNLFTLNSSHNFSIRSSSVVGIWQYQNSPINIIANGSADSPNIIIFPYYATLSLSGSGNNQYMESSRYKNAFSLNTILANINIGADPIETGGISADSIILSFTGSGLFNPDNPAKLGVFPVNLIDKEGNVLDTKQCTPIRSETEKISTCLITFPLSTSASSGNSVVYSLQAPNPVIQKLNNGAPGEDMNVKLFLNDVIWSDGTTSNIHWNSKNQPTQIFDYTYN